jgi:hypothetical protein
MYMYDTDLSTHLWSSQHGLVLPPPNKKNWFQETREKIFRMGNSPRGLLNLVSRDFFPTFLSPVTSQSRDFVVSTVILTVEYLGEFQRHLWKYFRAGISGPEKMLCEKAEFDNLLRLSLFAVLIVKGGSLQVAKNYWLMKICICWQIPIVT